jgi:hypothetical protein
MAHIMVLRTIPTSGHTITGIVRRGRARAVGAGVERERMMLGRTPGDFLRAMRVRGIGWPGMGDCRGVAGSPLRKYHPARVIHHPARQPACTARKSPRAISRLGGCNLRHGGYLEAHAIRARACFVVNSPFLCRASTLAMNWRIKDRPPTPRQVSPCAHALASAPQGVLPQAGRVSPRSS